MRYALRRIITPQVDREAIAQAILDEDGGVLGGYVNDDTIIHVGSNLDANGLFCIYCLDTLSVVQANRWFFRHRNTNDCLGSDQYLGILNPSGDGW